MSSDVSSDTTSLTANVVMEDGRTCSTSITFPLGQLVMYEIHQKGGTANPHLRYRHYDGTKRNIPFVCDPGFRVQPQSGYETPEIVDEEEEKANKLYLPTPNQHTKLIYIFVDAEGNIAPEFSPWKALRRVAKLVRKQESNRVRAQSGYEEEENGEKLQTTGEQIIRREDNVTKSQNVTFIDETKDYAYDQPTPVDPTRMLSDINDASLGNFFSRPVEIYQYDWSTDTGFGVQINPWQLFLRNPRVCNRISNFNLFRATMKIKCVINGNAFFFGRLLVSYEPFGLYNAWEQNRFIGNLADAVHESQCPHIWVNPTTSSGGTMTIPYFYHKNYCSLSELDAESMGYLNIREMAPLTTANGGSDVLTVSFFAWLEDVQLSGLTTQNYFTMIAQSGTEQDEANEKGIVSRPATTVAKYAGYLKGVPYIGKFALATELGATTVANVAKLFGYCKPPITKDVMFVKQMGQSSLATCTNPEAIQKLTIDDKQELTIDPEIAGISNVDTMDIRNIAMRESYFGFFAWEASDATQTLLWNARVTPVIWNNRTGIGGNTEYHFPACTVAALPFRYWTGTMRYRFQVVCTPFHRGRLKIVYDPNYITWWEDSQGETLNEYNTAYTHIIDIAEQTDFTIEVGNTQPYTLLDHHYPGLDGLTEVVSDAQYTSKGPGNGVIAVYVQNNLTAPATISGQTNEVRVITSISAGDDFECFVPEDHFMKFFPYGQPSYTVRDSQGEVIEAVKKEVVEKKKKSKTVKKQAGMEQTYTEPVAGFNVDQLAAPQHTKSIRLGIGKTNTSANVNKVFTGESITNFRTLIKRYMTYRALGPYAGDDAQRNYQVRLPWLPIPRGYDPSSGTNTGFIDRYTDINSVEYGYNYVNTTLLNWLTYCHSGVRGSVRYKFITQHLDGDYDKAVTVSATRVCEENPAFTNQVRYKYENLEAPDYDDDPNEAARSGVYNLDSDYTYNTTSVNPMYQGAAFMQGAVNPTLEFEVPFYSRYRFMPGKRNSILDFIGECFDLTISCYSTVKDRHFLLAAAGEDFQLYYWTGMPPMFFEQIPPTAGA